MSLPPASPNQTKSGVGWYAVSLAPPHHLHHLRCPAAMTAGWIVDESWLSTSPLNDLVPPNIWPWNMELASCPSCPQRPPVTFMSLGAKLLRKSLEPQWALAWVWPHPHAHWAMSTPTLEFYYSRNILPGLLFMENYFYFPLFSLQTSTHQWDHSWTFYIEEEQHITSRSPTGQS